MAADLHIHVMTDNLTEDDMLLFNSSHMGSSYFVGFGAPFDSPEEQANARRVAMLKAEPGREDGNYQLIADTPNIWIGEVSWLKAALIEGGEERFIPGPVQAVSDLIPDYPHPELTTELRDKILSALKVTNTTQYTIAKPEEVEEFLNQHIGKKIFTISW